MQLLTAINFCLRGSGLDPISDPTTENPAAGLAKEVIERTRREILETGYRFNIREITLQVDVNNRVPIAQSLLRVNLPKHFSERVDESEGGNFVWNFNEDDWHGEAMENIPVIHDITDLNNMPEGFGRWIARQSALNFFSEHRGNDIPIPRKLVADRNEARAKAENSLPEVSIRTATGWAALRRRAIRN